MDAIELPRLSHSCAAHLVSFSYPPSFLRQWPHQNQPVWGNTPYSDAGRYPKMRLAMPVLKKRLHLSHAAAP